jgi:hypothetical protein
MAPRYYIDDYDERVRYIDLNGNAHDIPLRNLTVEQLLAVVRIYRLKREPSWNESTLTERLRAAMPRWDGNLQNLDHAIRRHWRDRDMRARPYRDV